jgi:hypothetical protein
MATVKPSQHARQRLGQLVPRVLLGLILAPIAVGLCGAGFQFVATQLDARQYPPPGQLAFAPVLARLGFFRLELFPVPKADPDLPPLQRAEEQAFFNSAKYLDSLLATHQAFASALEQVRQTRALGELPLLVVIGSASDNATGVQRQLQDDLARLSTDSVERVIPGATHAGLVDQKDSAALTTAALRELFQAVRSGQPFIGH